jgi:hypothetical protein
MALPSPSLMILSKGFHTVESALSHVFIEQTSGPPMTVILQIQGMCLLHTRGS